MSADLDPSSGGPVLARRHPSRPSNREGALAQLDTAQADFERAIEAANRAIHARAIAAKGARAEGVTLVEIAAHLKLKKHGNVQSLLARLRRAQARGKTLRLWEKRDDS